MIRLLCNQCGQGGKVLHVIRAVWDEPSGPREDYDSPPVHLHWDCITAWVARRNAEMLVDQEPPF